jgi:hypothetical protein
MNTRLINLLRLGTLGAIALTLNACSLFNVGGSVGGNNSGESKPVTLNASCEQREEDGYYDKITLDVRQNVVHSLDWLRNPRQGKCRFQLKDFTQVATQPQTDLQSRKDKKCHLYIWQDARFVTVSTNNCAKVCAVNSRVLPILLDPHTGGCSKVSR